MTRIGIRHDDARSLMSLNDRFAKWYIIGFMYGIDGTTWYAMPKEAPDEGITEDSAEHLTEVLTIDLRARQAETSQKGGRPQRREAPRYRGRTGHPIVEPLGVERMTT